MNIKCQKNTDEDFRGWKFEWGDHKTRADVVND